MQQLINEQIFKALLTREELVKQKEEIEKAIKSYDNYLEETLINSLPTGTNRCNIQGVDIKIVKAKETPAISSTITPEVVNELHQRINAKEPIVKWKPDLITAAFNNLTQEQKNAISDVVYFRKQTSKIEVSRA